MDCQTEFLHLGWSKNLQLQMEFLRCQFEGIQAAGVSATVLRRLAFTLPATAGSGADWQSQTAKIKEK